MLHTTTDTIAVTINNDKQIKEINQSINLIISGSLPYYKAIFNQMLYKNPLNANNLYHFLSKEQDEKNAKLSTKTTYIKVIFLFNKFLGFKDFNKITRNDIIDYLNSLKKSEASDPTHRLCSFNEIL